MQCNDLTPGVNAEHSLVSNRRFEVVILARCGTSIAGEEPPGRQQDRQATPETGIGSACFEIASVIDRTGGRVLAVSFAP
jgi:hypothetical protein